MNKEIAPPRIKTLDAEKIAGGRRELAKLFDVTTQAVWKWGEYVPDLRAYQLREMFPEEFEKRGSKAA